MESTSEPPQAQSWEGESKAQAAKTQGVTHLSELKSWAEQSLWARECREERAMKGLHNSAKEPQKCMHGLNCRVKKEEIDS